MGNLEMTKPINTQIGYYKIYKGMYFIYDERHEII